MDQMSHRTAQPNCLRSVAQKGAYWSGRPGSNRRHLPWQGSTLPLSYSRSYMLKYNGQRTCGQRARRHGVCDLRMRNRRILFFVSFTERMYYAR